jgi:hypothetical protein
MKTVNDEGIVPISEISVLARKKICYNCSNIDYDFNMLTGLIYNVVVYFCHDCDETLPTCPGCGEKVLKNDPRTVKEGKTYHLDCE